jgi:hypothetical protein
MVAWPETRNPNALSTPNAGASNLADGAALENSDGSTILNGSQGTAKISCATENDGHRFGRFMSHNLADYHVPVNADVHTIDVMFVEEKDDEINPLGVKGVGEIGIVGTAAAVAMRSIMRPANACAICRSRSTS